MATVAPARNAPLHRECSLVRPCFGWRSRRPGRPLYSQIHLLALSERGEDSILVGPACKSVTMTGPLSGTGQ
jgi:hypothetical protein